MFLVNKFNSTTILRNINRSLSYDVTKATLAGTVPINRDAAENYDLNKEYPRLSLDAFYENLTHFKLGD
jgi:hypothetical protein